MKAKLFRPLASLLLLLSLCALWAGCASTPKVDWDSRVGSYTYDQAVQELGPPLLSTKLNAGGTVADWPLGHHSSSVGFGVGGGGYGSGVGVGMGQTIGHDEYLRLTFDQNGTLKAWSRDYR